MKQIEVSDGLAKLGRADDRTVKIFVDDHDVAAAVVVREVADQHRVRPSLSRGFCHGLGAAGRDGAEMVDAVGRQFQQRRRQLADLQIDLPHDVPHRRFVAELVDRAVAKIADCRREVFEVGQPAGAVRERRVNLEIACRSSTVRGNSDSRPKARFARTATYASPRLGASIPGLRSIRRACRRLRRAHSGRSSGPAACRSSINFSTYSS